MNNKVKEFRENMHMTQSELATRSGISRTTISLIETHKLDNIESKTMLAIAIALNCDIGDIFFKETVNLTQQQLEKDV